MFRATFVRTEIIAVWGPLVSFETLAGGGRPVGYQAQLFYFLLRAYESPSTLSLPYCLYSCRGAMYATLQLAPPPPEPGEHLARRARTLLGFPQSREPGVDDGFVCTT